MIQTQTRVGSLSMAATDKQLHSLKQAAAAGMVAPPADRQNTIIESLMIRNGNNNDRLSNALARLTQINDRLLGCMPTDKGGVEPTPSQEGIFAALERSLITSETLADLIYEQIRRLESI